MTGFSELLRKELLEAWRTRRLPVIGLLFLGLGISAPVVMKLIPSIVETLAPAGFEIRIPVIGLSEVLDQFLKNTIQFGALAAILVTMGSVASEKERGTAAFVLAKPVTRAAFLATKLVAIGALFAIAIGLAAIGGWAYTALLFEPPPIVPWLGMSATIWLSTVVYVSITFLGSVVMRSPLGAAGVGFAGLIALSIPSVIPTLAPWLPAGLIALAKAIASGTIGPDLDPPRTIGVSFLVAGAAIGLGFWRFRQIEL